MTWTPLVTLVLVASPLCLSDDMEPIRSPVLAQRPTTPDGDVAWLLVDDQTCPTPAMSWLSTWYRPWTRSALGAEFRLPVPLGQEPGPLGAELWCGRRRYPLALEVEAGQYAENTLRVAPHYSGEPPPRTAIERRALDAAYARASPQRLWRQTFRVPAAGRETSPFGRRRTFNGLVKSRHRGIDLDGRIGDPVLAANDGRVLFVAHDFYYVGNAVLLDHGEGLVTLYLHLSQIDVEQGQAVRAGERIGGIGRTGRVTGPHLHFAVSWNGTFVNPRALTDLYQPPSCSVESTHSPEATTPN